MYDGSLDFLPSGTASGDRRGTVKSTTWKRSATAPVALHQDPFVVPSFVLIDEIRARRQPPSRVGFKPVLCITALWPTRLPQWVIRVVPTGSRASRHVRYASNSDRSRCVAANRRDVPQATVSSRSTVTLIRSPRRRGLTGSVTPQSRLLLRF